MNHLQLAARAQLFDPRYKMDKMPEFPAMRAVCDGFAGVLGSRLAKETWTADDLVGPLVLCRAEKTGLYLVCLFLEIYAHAGGSGGTLGSYVEFVGEGGTTRAPFIGDISVPCDGGHQVESYVGTAHALEGTDFTLTYELASLVGTSVSFVCHAAIHNLA